MMARLTRNTDSDNNIMLGTVDCYNHFNSRIFEYGILKAVKEASFTRGGHSYAYRRTVYDRGQDAVKRSSTLFALGKTVKA